MSNHADPFKQMRLNESKLDINYLRTILKYEKETGNFIWINSINNKIKNGTVAGKQTNIGYRKIYIRNIGYSEHRLAWFYVTGEWPKHEIDHKDMDRGNNTWSNLREATDTQNFGNQRAYKSNTSGVKGVNWSNGKWVCRIQVNNKRIALGYFNDINEAAKVYKEAAIKYFGEFARIE